MKYQLRDADLKPLEWQLWTSENALNPLPSYINLISFTLSNSCSNAKQLNQIQITIMQNTWYTTDYQIFRFIKLTKMWLTCAGIPDENSTKPAPDGKLMSEELDWSHTWQEQTGYYYKYKNGSFATTEKPVRI